MHNRYEELDSLRGLAALTVMLLHVYGIFPVENKLAKLFIEYGPLRLFISGGEAVILFFVLSGFVLSIPFYKNKQSNYSSFVIKRACRIYIPYLFAIGASIICSKLFYSGEIHGLSGYFNSFWNLPINGQLLREHLLFIGTFLSNLDFAVWSLVHEMRISLVFPFLMFLIVRLDWKKGVGLAFLFSICSVILFDLFKYQESESTGTELFATINYTGMFIVGALLAQHREWLKNKFMNFSVKIKILFFSAGLLMYAYLHPSFAIKMFLFHNIDFFYRTVIDSWAITFGAALLILAALSSTLFSEILKNRIINYLGKISYSLYLIHIVVFYACIHSLHKLIPLWSIYIIAVAITLVSASLMYKFIEKPSITLGKLLTGKINRKNRKVNINATFAEQKST
ncbi:acyltransferase family protein [Paenibacillus nasutitermitis]|uniref:Acyltransferase n=1 Tax=Paenibacillus nasutitermitis TaxID=1652958 RepID=A0A917DUX2_9BACL|nr:acyltransferase [Paenibacillus nasutitermitis]GGD73427.1 acyltransferase [Paenibacillus nasutitermitis]